MIPRQVTDTLILLYLSFINYMAFISLLLYEFFSSCLGGVGGGCYYGGCFHFQLLWHGYYLHLTVGIARDGGWTGEQCKGTDEEMIS